ncbi:RNA polymerase sigma factor [Sphingobacterium sp. MYb382]|uniref:RNA polymerase sigma factor n=1 Tax=Sphingobacterium sp. MYb382 TaxID=2745278 RepID=UPI003098401F
MHKISKQQENTRYLTLLQQGNERGLDFFYNRFYGYLFFRTLHATKDECATESIVQEALLRLWLFRGQVKDVEGILSFLKTQVKSAIHIFYSKSQNKFNRRLLRLDAIEDYQDFLLGYEMEEEVEIDLLYLEQLEEEKEIRLNQINNLLPNLTLQQQLFIKLCLKYSFNYERIAYYLGGISDYEVGLQVEKAIATLHAIFHSSQKMELVSRSAKPILDGVLDEKQAQIFHMRYELHLSFAQISESLQLDSIMVKKLFIEAHTKIKAVKKTN